MTGHDSGVRSSKEMETEVREDFTITEKAPTRAFSSLKKLIGAFTFENPLRHYAKQT